MDNKGKVALNEKKMAERFEEIHRSKKMTDKIDRSKETEKDKRDRSINSLR